MAAGDNWFVRSCKTSSSGSNGGIPEGGGGSGNDSDDYGDDNDNCGGSKGDRGGSNGGSCDVGDL